MSTTYFTFILKCVSAAPLVAEDHRPSILMMTGAAAEVDIAATASNLSSATLKALPTSKSSKRKLERMISPGFDDGTLYLAESEGKGLGLFANSTIEKSVHV